MLVIPGSERVNAKMFESSYGRTQLNIVDEMAISPLLSPLLAAVQIPARFPAFFKGATSRYVASVFAPNKTTCIVKLKETTTYTHRKVEKY